MKKLFNVFPPCLIIAVFVPFLVSVITFGCSDDDDNVIGSKEFVPKLEDFANYKTWEVIDYTIGASNPVLMDAHKGDDDSYSRRVYISSSTTIQGTEYLQGAIVVKETFTWEGNVKKFAAMGGILAMVKRSGNFNPKGGGWEWFELSSDLSAIVGRGGEEMLNGMCNSCHDMAKAQTGGADYVFPHPAEYEAEEAIFSDYTTEDLISVR